MNSRGILCIARPDAYFNPNLLFVLSAAAVRSVFRFFLKKLYPPWWEQPFVLAVNEILG